MWVSTFHSACVRILRATPTGWATEGSFTIYDDADSRRLIEMIVAEMGLDTKRLPPRSVAAVIGQAKSELIDFETFREPARARARSVRAPDRRRLRRSTSSGWWRPTPWTSTTS